MDVAVVEKLAVAVGLGLLVGFQREWAEPSIAGIRTFALITLFGTLVGLSAETFGGWAIAAGLLAVAALVVTGSVLEGRRAEEPPGLTTEFAALVMYAVGVAIAVGHLAVGVLVGAGTAVLLQWKAPLHRFVDRVGAADVRAIFQLVLIGLVILPVLPRRALDPYGVLVPFEIWLMVVLIVGISLAGYTAARLFGAGVGTLMAGVLGGLISSTATTVSFARSSRRAPETVELGAMVVTIASTIVFARVLFEVGVVAPEVLPGVAGPLVAMLAVMTLISAAMWLAGRRHGPPAAVEGGPPTEFKSAIVFGALYAAVLLAVALANRHFGDRGLFTVAVLSGTTDVDAITLSTAQMIKKGQVASDTGWRMILVGALSNLAVKGLAVAALADRRMTARVAAAFGAAILCGLAILFLWR